MVQFTLLNTRQAGRDRMVRHFPFQIGRAPGAHLALEGDGVWDRHLEVRFQPGDGFHLHTHPGALVSINGERVQQARLRNGDLLEIGSVQLRFWLAAAAQHSLRPRETLTWLALGVLFLVQLGLIYKLLG